jgi:hypothetical protein
MPGSLGNEYRVNTDVQTDTDVSLNVGMHPLWHLLDQQQKQVLRYELQF